LTNSTAVGRRNLTDLSPGDHLVVSRPGYTHHGLYLGSDRVIHYSGLSDSSGERRVEETTLALFRLGGPVTVRLHRRPKYARELAIERARSKIGQAKYCFFTNNCEHFVNWCIDGTHASEQIDQGTAVAAYGISAGAGPAARALVSSCGAVRGLSGSGIVSGLNSIGRVVGFGPAGGLAIMVGGAAFAAAELLNRTVLAENDALEVGERRARQKGRTVSYVAAAGGASSALGAVYLCGSVTGFSAPGLTSGLAAIGRVLGGGMARGTALTVVLPIALAFGAGYATYKWYQQRPTEAAR
jgi:hypothetical protein